MKNTRQALRNRSTSNVPSGLAELHQVDARQVAGRVVEEHVLAARIAGVDPALFGQVCQRLIVVSYCTPGSPQYQAPSAILRHHFAGLVDGAGRAWRRSPSAWSRACPRRTACMNSSVTRTERFAFWNRIEL